MCIQVGHGPRRRNPVSPNTRPVRDVDTYDQYDHPRTSRLPSSRNYDHRHSTSQRPHAPPPRAPSRGHDRRNASQYPPPRNYDRFMISDSQRWPPPRDYDRRSASRDPPPRNHGRSRTSDSQRSHRRGDYSRGRDNSISQDSVPRGRSRPSSQHPAPRDSSLRQSSQNPAPGGSGSQQPPQGPAPRKSNRAASKRPANRER